MLFFVFLSFRLRSILLERWNCTGTSATRSFCWSKWNVFKNIDVKFRSSVFPQSPTAKTGVRSKEERRREFISRSTLDRVSWKILCSFLRPCESLLPPFWLFYNEQHFFVNGWLAFSSRLGSWMADCSLHWNWPPDTCISWSGAYSIASCILNVLIVFCSILSLMRLFFPIWLCTVVFEIFFLPLLYKSQRSVRFIALSGPEIWQW